MNWSVPAAIKWIRALEQFDLQYVEQPVPDFDLEGMAQVRRAVATPIAADEACTSVRSALELIKAEACDVFVVYPSEAGGLTRARADRRPRGGGGQVVRDRQLGRARRRDDGQRPRRRRVDELPVCERHPLSTSAKRRPDDAVEIEHGLITVSHDPGLGVTLDPAEHAAPRRARAPRVTVLRRHQGRRAERRPDSLRSFPDEGGGSNMSDKPTESSLSRARSAGATC